MSPKAGWIWGLVLFNGCALAPDPTEDFRMNLRREVTAQRWEFKDLGSPWTPFLEEYVVHWKFRELVHPWGPKIKAAFRLVDYPKGDLFATVFLPPGPPRGTLFVLHGYLASLGNFSGIMRVMLREGWAVTALDLPGHGLSSGLRAGIDDFSDYSLAIAAWLQSLEEIDDRLPRPWVVLGHSTGASAVIDLSRFREPPWDVLILSAPLIRHAYWHLGQGLAWFNQWWLHNLQPLVSPDPLVGIYNVPLSWVLALGRWESGLRLEPRPSIMVLLHQDTQDQVVDYRHNLPRVARGFPLNRTFWQSGMGHVTLADFHRYEEAFSPLLEYLLEFLGQNGER